MTPVVFSTALLPPPAWFAAFLQSADASIDLFEHFVKQTHRNRFRLLTANGPLNISVPLEKLPQGVRAVKEVRISYAEDWQRKALQAIRSAYNNAPYFEHYEEDFMAVFAQQPVHLWEYNHALLQWAFSCLDRPVSIRYTQAYAEQVSNDFRVFDFCVPELSLPASPYTQVFRHKFGFTPHLSILDLLFNKGPEAPALL